MLVTLDSITTKITKGTTPTSVGCTFENSGVNFIKSESLGNSRNIDRSKFAFISEQTHEKLKRSQIEKNDILFSMAGMFLGKTGIVTDDLVPANTNQAVAIIRIDTEKANHEYVYYYLNQRLAVMYQYQIIIKKMEEENGKHPNTSEVLSKMFSEEEYRDRLYDALGKLKASYDAVSQEKNDKQLRKQLTLI